MRRRRAPSKNGAQPNRSTRRLWRTAVFAACVLLANALVGDRGLTETLRARQAFEDASRNLLRLKRENAALREAARMLRDDPATIESVARGELGLARRGEIVVTLRPRPLRFREPAPARGALSPQ